MVAVALLDVNETLFGLGPVEAALGELGLPDDVAALWFARILRDGMAATLRGEPTPFPDLARHHVAVLGDEHGLDLGAPDAADQVVDAFGRVEPHEQVAPALRRLRDGGVRPVALTNGTAAIARGVLERAGVSSFVDARDVGDADGTWKPHPAAYAAACRALDAAPADAALIAVHPWDVAGASAAGLTGAWVRRGARWPAAWREPAVTGDDLLDVAERLVAPAA